MASAPPVPLPDFSLKSHKGDAFGKEQLLGDFALLYLGSLANADHTKSSLERMLHIVQQQGSHLLPWRRSPLNGGQTLTCIAAATSEHAVEVGQEPQDTQISPEPVQIAANSRHKLLHSSKQALALKIAIPHPCSSRQHAQTDWLDSLITLPSSLDVKMMCHWCWCSQQNSGF